MVNCVFGFILAWVLVRYDFFGKRLLNGVIELPFALPTAVAGITLSKLYSDTGFFGSFFASYGIQIAYTKIGLTIAMVFVGIPFVVRSIQPVLEKLDPTYEEAGSMLGASQFTIFRRIIFPELRPALLTGFGLALPGASANTAASSTFPATVPSIIRRSFLTSSCRSSITSITPAPRPSHWPCWSSPLSHCFLSI